MMYKPESLWYSWRDQRWAQMLKEGKTFKEIAKSSAYPYTPAYVKRRLRAMGVVR